MNEIVSKLLLAGDKFMPEMHLRQPGFAYSACDHLLKLKKEFKNYILRLRYIYQNELDKVCFLEGQLLIKYYMIKHLTFC